VESLHSNNSLNILEIQIKIIFFRHSIHFRSSFLSQINSIFIIQNVFGKNSVDLIQCNDPNKRIFSFIEEVILNDKVSKECEYKNLIFQSFK
jgi:hypothetical protein